MFPVETFGEWLERELELRGWKQAELARRAHIQNATLSRIITGSRNVGPDVALELARALDISADTVFRRAGLLPALPPPVAEEREIVAIVREQPAPVRSTLLSMLRGLSRRPAPLPAVDAGQAELDAIYQRLPEEWRPEFVRTSRKFEQNAHGVAPRIIGGEDEAEREPTPRQPGLDG